MLFMNELCDVFVLPEATSKCFGHTHGFGCPRPWSRNYASSIQMGLRGVWMQDKSEVCKCGYLHISLILCNMSLDRFCSCTIKHALAFAICL